MKFDYQYRTTDNIVHSGVVVARNRDAAFQILKGQGVRPFKLVPSRGILNVFLGTGKRWVAIVVLAFLLVLLLVQVAQFRQAAVEATLWEPRAQIYGDSDVLSLASANGWKSVFAYEGDRFLAQHAIPGVACSCTHDLEEREKKAAAVADVYEDDVVILPSDLDEVKKIKRMVNGMKRELRRYIAAGGSVASYVERLDVRLMTEISILRLAQEEIGRCADVEVARERNKKLRSIGLPMVSIDEKND